MDARDAAALKDKWYKSIDDQRMTAVVELPKIDRETGEVSADDETEEVVVTIHFEVCSLCNGKGKHVNPSIDSNGLSREDFDDDPSFEEDYFAGAYDVPCYTCKGLRVEPVINWDSATLNPALKKRLRDHFDAISELAEERELQARYQW